MTKRFELVVALVGTVGCLLGIFAIPAPIATTDYIMGYSMLAVVKWLLIIGCGALAVLYWLLLFLELSVAGENNHKKDKG